MFISDKLIYLALPKTASSQILKWLARSTDGKKVGEQHSRLPARLLRKNKRYIVGSIRDPWDWYVSLWAFGCVSQSLLYKSTVIRNPIWQFGKLTFRRPEILKSLPCRPLTLLRCIRNEMTKPVEIWRRTYEDHDDPHRFRQWLRLVLDGRRQLDFFGHGYALSPISSFAGLLVYYYIRLHSADISRIHSFKYIRDLDHLKEFDQENNLLDFVIRAESLEEDLIQALQNAGYELSQQQKDLIRDAKREKKNASVHRDTAFYYDPQTVALVAEKEQFIIEKYNYSPPGLD